MSELQRTYDHDAYLTTRQIIDHDIFVNMSDGKSRVQSVTDVLDHYCSITGKYNKMTPTQKYAFLDEIGNQIDLAIDDARLDIGYIISKEEHNGSGEDDSGSEGVTLSRDGDDNGEVGGAEEDCAECDEPDQASSEADRQLI